MRRRNRAGDLGTQAGASVIVPVVRVGEMNVFVCQPFMSMPVAVWHAR